MSFSELVYLKLYAETYCVLEQYARPQGKLVPHTTISGQVQSDVPSLQLLPIVYQKASLGI